MELIGGIQVESLLFKRESLYDSSNIVEITASDIQDKIKKESEDEEVENSGNNSFKISNENNKDVEINKTNQEYQDNNRRKDKRETEKDKQGTGSTETVQVKCILNNVMDDLHSQKKITSPQAVEARTTSKKKVIINHKDKAIFLNKKKKLKKLTGTFKSR